MTERQSVAYVRLVLKTTRTGFETGTHFVSTLFVFVFDPYNSLDVILELNSKHTVTINPDSSGSLVLLQIVVLPFVLSSFSGAFVSPFYHILSSLRSYRSTL